MKISIARDGDTIVTIKDFEDIASVGEITQMIAELEIIKLELLDLFQEQGDGE